MKPTGFWHKCKSCAKIEPVSLQEWHQLWICDECIEKYGDITVIDDVIKDEKKLLLVAKIWEHKFQEEYINPKSMGKEKAASNLSIYQKRIEGIKSNIKMYEDYKLTHYHPYDT